MKGWSDLNLDRFITLSPRNHSRANSLERIDSRIFEDKNENLDLQKFFSGISEESKKNGYRLTAAKKKMEDHCSKMIQVSQEAFKILEQTNSKYVLRKKNELKNGLMKGLWNNFKKFIDKINKNFDSVFKNQSELDFSSLTEKYLEVCLFNLKYFYEKIFFLSTKKYSKHKFDDQRHHKFSFDEGGRNYTDDFCNMNKRENVESSGLSKRSVTSESFKSEKYENEMQKCLNALIQCKKLPVRKFSSSSNSFFLDKKCNNNKDSHNISFENSFPNKDHNNHALDEICMEIGSFYPNNNFIMANCDRLSIPSENENYSIFGNENQRKKNRYNSFESNNHSFGFDIKEDVIINSKPNDIFTNNKQIIEEEDEEENTTTNKLVSEKNIEFTLTNSNWNIDEGKKRRKWKQQEDDFLLQVLIDNFPNKPNKKICKYISEKLQRSNESLKKRFNIIKKNNSELFSEMKLKIINSITETKSKENQTIPMNVHSKQSDISLSINKKNIFNETSQTSNSIKWCKSTFNKIKDYIKDEPKRFDQIYLFLKLDSENERMRLESDLINLQEICKLRASEEKFVFIKVKIKEALMKPDPGIFNKDNYSAILDYIFTSFYYIDFEPIMYSELKVKVINHFENLQENISNFDEQFQNYLLQSQFFSIQRKEIYFI